MKTIRNALVLTCLSLIVMGRTVYSGEKTVWTGLSVAGNFEPVVIPKTPGPVTLELAFTPILFHPEVRCTEYSLRVSRLLNLQYQGDTAWVVPLDSGKWYSKSIELVIPPNDTCGIEISIQCGRIPTQFAAYFVTTGDSLEFYRGNPRGYHPLEPPVYDYHNPKRDTLTQEQLNKIYTISLDLRKSSHLSIAKRILGEIPDSCKHKEYEGIYIMKITLEQVFKLGDEGIDLDAVNWDEFAPPKDTTSTSPQKSDSTEPRGALPNPESLGTTELVNGISLDHVDGATPGGTGISIGPTIRFHLRLNNNSGSIITGMTNAFRLYSPDGAQWQPPDNQAGNGSSIWNPSINWNLYFGTPFVFFLNVNGSGVDSIEFGAFRILEPGLPNGFNQITWIIETHVNFPSNSGKTLCIDTVSWPAVDWVWALPNNQSFKPAWDGPHCFTITEGEISFSGYLKYLDPVPPTTDEKPMRFATIEMWDADLVGGNLLDSYVTNSNGFFSLGPSPQNDVSGGQDIFFRIYAKNQAAYVTESYNGSIYKVQTPTQNDMLSGDYDTTIVATLAQSDFFGAANIVLDAYQGWVGFGTYVPSAVQVVLRNDSATGFHANQRAMYINKSNNPAARYPDTWDKDVIYHEYGHVIEWDLGFFDASIGGDHGWATFETIDFASTEAFAHWLSSVLRLSKYQKNYFNNFVDSFWVNLENGKYGLNNTTFGSVNHRGKNYEGAIAGMLWDVYDNINDDTSTFGGPFSPDGIGDTLNLGTNEILEVCLKNTFSGHKPDNIDDFWESWFLPASYGHVQAMLDIWYEHGDASLICIGIRGDLNADGMYEVSVLDLTYIVDRLFRGGPRSPRPLEADVNASGGEPNVLDLTFIIDRMFRGGPPPPICP